MKLHDLANLPVVNQELVAELYGDTSDAEMIEMQQELWQGIKADIFRELNEISELWSRDPGEEVRRMMHRVAGYSGSGGLQRCCEILRAAEKMVIPADEVPEALQIAAASAREGISQIEERYPHLLAGS
jgi:hypothetical protein